MMKKMFGLLFVVCLVSGLFLSVIPMGVVATPVFIDSNMGPYSANFGIIRTFPYVGTDYSAVGQSFVGNGLAVTEAMFNLAWAASSYGDGHLQAAIYAASYGWDNLNARPSGVPLAVSSLVASSVVPVSGAPAWVSFAFDGSFVAESGVSYFVVVYMADGTIGNQWLLVSLSASGVGNGGVLSAYRNGWGADSVSPHRNVMFQLFGELAGYVVSYDANFPIGSVGSGSVPLDNNAYVVGDPVVVAANSGGLACSGYRFLGWSFNSSAVTADFVVEGNNVVPSSFIMPSHDVFLFAVWVSVVTPTPTLTPVPSGPVVVPSDFVELGLRFRDDEYSVFGVVGFGLGERSGGSVASAVTSLTGSSSVSFGFRVWLVGEVFEEELTDGVPVASSVLTAGGNGSFAGWVSGFWDCPDVKRLELGGSALRVMLYCTVGDSDDAVAVAEFVSPVLMTEWLVGGTWEFCVFVEYDAVSSLVVSWSGVYGSAGIYGVLIVEPSVFELMFFRLLNLDFVGFVFSPYVFVFGSLFYVFLFVAVFGAYYIWHMKFSVIVFMLIFFGSAGGLVWVFFPPAAAVLACVLMCVGIGVILFRMFR